MILDVILEQTDAEAIRRLHGEALGYPPRLKRSVSMYAFCTVDNQADRTVLETNGAGPCQIIVLHCGPGLGALGHYAGTPNPLEIVAAVEFMISKLRAPPVSAVFSAGMVEDGKAQRDYQHAILDGVKRRRHSLEQVAWKQPIWRDGPGRGRVYAAGACLYFPLAEKVAFYEYLDELVGRDEDSDGIRRYAYA